VWVERLSLANQPYATADRCHGHCKGADGSRGLATIRPGAPFRTEPALEPGRPPSAPPLLSLDRQRAVAPIELAAAAGAPPDRAAPARHTSLPRFQHPAPSVLSVHG
jgi:hypothetical protein